MAATPTHKYSDLLSDHNKWDDPMPLYTDIIALMGGAAMTNSTETAQAIINVATCSPIAIAFVIQGNEDHVHIGHTPTLFPQDITNSIKYDNHVMVMVGDKFDASIPVILPASAFQRTSTACTLVLLPSSEGPVTVPHCLSFVLDLTAPLSPTLLKFTPTVP